MVPLPDVKVSRASARAPARGAVPGRGADRQRGGAHTLGPPEQITPLGCWAHARRHVAEAVRLGEPRAAPYLSRVDRLFRLDARATTGILPLPPRSALAVALGYLLGQRASLKRCVTTPDAYLDNNAAENAIRPLKQRVNCVQRAVSRFRGS